MSSSLPYTDRYVKYINPELVADSRDAFYLDLQLDTWYYQESETLGSFELGNGPLTGAQGFVAFATKQVDALSQAVDGCGCMRLCGAQVDYKPNGLKSPYTTAIYVGRPTDGDGDALLRALQAELRRLEQEHPIIAIKVPFDLRVALRGEDATIHELWLPGAGQVRFGATWSQWADPIHSFSVVMPAALEGTASWRAEFQLSVVSLFQADNTDELTRVRKAWKQFREEYPAATSFTGKPDDYYVVTLAEVPEDTPPNNRTLQERNAPCLQTTITRWEQALGRPFQWSISLDE